MDDESIPDNTEDQEDNKNHYESGFSSDSTNIGREEPQCVLCLSSIGIIIQDGKNELRWLPCSCCCCCLNCFKKEHRNGSIKCGSSSRFPEINNYCDLTKVEHKVKSLDKLRVDMNGRGAVEEAADDDGRDDDLRKAPEVKQHFCYNCLGKKNVHTPANLYCTEQSCMKWYCAKHKGIHDENEVQEHTFIDVDTYEQRPDLHGAQSVCEVPGHGAIACGICFKSSCAICSPSEPCTAEEGHRWEPLRRIDEILDEQFKGLITKTEDKIIECEKDISSTKKDHKKLTNDYRVMNDDVEKHTTAQIQSIKRGSKKVKNVISEHQHTNSEVLQEYDRCMSDRINNLKELKTSVMTLNRLSTLEKLERRSEIVDTIEKATTETTDCVKWKSPLALTKRGPTGNLALGAASVPTSLQYFDSLNVIGNAYCYAAGFLDCGKLWLGHQRGLKSSKSVDNLREPLQEAHEVKSCVSVAPYKDNIYFTEEDSDEVEVQYRKGRVKAFMRVDQVDQAKLAKPTYIFEYNIEQDVPATLAASENFLALTDNAKRSVKLFNLKTRKTKSYPLCNWHSGVCFHPDGDLLVTDEGLGTVSKHGIHCDLDEEPECKWILEDLEQPDAICIDYSGLIYVKSCSNQCIYVISEGKLVQTLRNEHIPTTYGEMCIHENNLVMACWEEHVFKHFKLNR